MTEHQRLSRHQEASSRYELGKKEASAKLVRTDVSFTSTSPFFDYTLVFAPHRKTNTVKGNTRFCRSRYSLHTMAAEADRGRCTEREPELQPFGSPPHAHPQACHFEPNEFHEFIMARREVKKTRLCIKGIDRLLRAPNAAADDASRLSNGVQGNHDRDKTYSSFRRCNNTVSRTQ